MGDRKRVAVTGMSVLTPLGDTLDGTLAALLAGRSAIGRWRSMDASRSYAKIGGDLGDYDDGARIAALAEALPPRMGEALGRLARRLPWSPRLGVLLAAAATLDGGLGPELAAATPVVLAGHNLAGRHLEAGFERFHADPGGMDGAWELYGLDTTAAAAISELLGSRAPAYTVGGACASGNIALQACYREITLHGARAALVVAPPPDPSSGILHAFAMLGALSITSFTDRPEVASRPWDAAREGFVPAHGGAAMLLEDWDHAIARGARVHAELRAVAVTSDANHLTLPDEGGQARAIGLALRRAGLQPEDIDFVSAHATSTPQGDLVELAALRRALGPHAHKVKINAAKSMLGHTFNAAALVEGVAAILQMNAGTLHGSRNIDALDPAVDLDVCAGGNTRAEVRHLLNDAFGFGGINTVSVFSRVDRLQAGDDRSRLAAWTLAGGAGRERLWRLPCQDQHEPHHSVPEPSFAAEETPAVTRISREMAVGVSPAREAVVVTGLALITPLGDTVDGVLDALMGARSGLGPWRAFPPPPGAARVGGDLSGRDLAPSLASLRARLPSPARARLDRLLRRAPWSVKLSLLVAAEAALSADLLDRPPAPEDTAVLVAGHNLNTRYLWDNWLTWLREPDYMDALLALHAPDTNHAACVSELMGSRGALLTVGASCASGNLGLRAAMDELRDGAAAVVLVAPIYEYAPPTLAALGRMGATTESLDPGAASRPFDEARDGFAPSHGAAAVVLETARGAAARGATPLAELLGAEAGSDACHRPPRPDPAEQAALIARLLDRAGLAPRDLGLVSAHAASTPAGDRAEAAALRLALGAAAAEIPVNAPKSMLGHTGWSSSLIEAILAIAQLRRGQMHGTANLDTPEPGAGLNLREAGPIRGDTALNNAFGFGGLSCVSLLRRLP